MIQVFSHLRAPAIATVALALSASLAFAAQGPSWAQVAHRPIGASVSLAGDDETAGDEATGTDEAGDNEESGTNDESSTDEQAGEDEATEPAEDAGDAQDVTETESADTPDSIGDGTEAGGDNCATDPTGLTTEELAAMRHGSIVCWAAQQTLTPQEFSNHGAFVSSWAHAGKGTTTLAAHAGKGGAHAATKGGHGKGKGHNRG